MSFRKFLRAQARSKRAAAIDKFQAIPKPPVVDGICACGCCHRPTKGACPQFTSDDGSGDGKRCAICDHSVLCHRRKGEPPPTDWDVPLKMPEHWRRFAPPGHPINNSKK